jgi:hypothetical protein
MTLKVFGWFNPVVIVVVMVMTVAAGVLTGFIMADSAFADRPWGGEPPVALNGDWAPANRCPVDNPTMLAADGVKAVTACVAEESPSGSVTFGSLAVATKASNHQFGLVFNQEALNETEASTLVAPTGGVLVDEPVQLPGGLRELLCPSSDRAVWSICRHSHDRGREDGHTDTVTWTMESAGAPYGFRLLAGLVSGVPFISVPVKVHLQNEMLGDHCYIGSDAEPIVLQPMNLTAPTGNDVFFDTNGTPNPSGLMEDLQLFVLQGARSFAVPAVSGCGIRGSYDRAIDGKVGLPSPAGGENSVTFNEATNHLIALEDAEGVAPNDGKELSKYWHSAVLPSEGARHEHGGGQRRWSHEEVEAYIRHRFRDRH